MSMKWKRNLPLVGVLLVLLAGLVFVLGRQRIIAYSSTSTPRAARAGQNEVSNQVEVFDDSLVHAVQVLMSDADYDSMITTYQETGLKEYFQADVIIDGVRINDVGIRLRGNASLRTALGGGGGEGTGFGAFAGGQPPEGMQMPEGGMPPFANGQVPEGMQGFVPPEQGQAPMEGQPEQQAPQSQEMQARGPGGEMPGNFPGGMGQGREAIAEELVKIPFMIKFDEYVDGQTYQGYAALAIRNYGTSYDEAQLQEPLSNEAAQQLGLPASQTAFTGFRINDGDAKLYVLAELINEEYLAKHFPDSQGVLYKADVGATLSYDGEEPSRYAERFTQETRVNDADMKPLIDFMRFLDQADDATFEAELPEWLDVDAFAKYLALNAVLANNDSMIGMNNNYYLYFNEDTQQMTVLLWDTNESLGKLGRNTNFDLTLAQQQGVGRMGGGSNVLLTRFIANDTFRALYEQALQAVYAVVWGSPGLAEKAQAYAELVLAANAQSALVDEERYQTAVESVLSFLEQRKLAVESSLTLDD